MAAYRAFFEAVKGVMTQLKTALKEKKFSSQVRLCAGACVWLCG